MEGVETTIRFHVEILAHGSQSGVWICKVCDYAFDILFLLIATWGVLHNWILLLVALLPAIVLFAVKVVIYRRTAKILHLPRLFFALPLFSLVQPWVNLYFNIIGSASRKKNFTWR